MKNIIYLLIACTGLVFASCEDFLDRQPKSSLSSKTYWQTEQDLKTWNAGMYDGLQSALRTNWIWWGDIRSGVFAERGTAYDRNLLYNGLTSGHGSTSWSSIYTTIYRANAAIKYIPTSSIGSTVSDTYLAQAYAMRALMYFYAIRVWGDVPMITEPTEDVATQERYYGRTSVMDIKKMLLDDLDKALEHFGPSSDLSTSSKYYLNRGSALAIKADVLMWYHEYDKALVVMDDLTKSYKYVLEASNSYVGMFLNPDNSKEMIFNLFWDSSQDGGGFGYAQEIASGSNTIKYHPTKRIYQELVIRKQEDVRVTVVMDTFWLSQRITPEEILEETYEKAYNGGYGNAAEFQIKCPKFTEFNAGTLTYNYIANAECNVRMPIYRLTDIMLLKAEALVLGSKKDRQGALDIVNTIRERAGWTDKAVLADYLTDKELIRLIIDERTVELWAEGKRWFDLVRNDLVKEYLDPYFKEEVPDAFKNPDGFDNGGITKPSADYIGGYGKMLWPLNQEVFRKNPAMAGQQNKPYEE